MHLNSLCRTAVFTFLLIAFSFSLRAEVRQGIDVLVAKDEVIDDDVYVFAQKATINGTIKGDLIVFGQQVDINGTVEGDLITSAQQVSINGKIGDDVRIAGQILTLRNGAEIGDDLVAAGYSLDCAKESRVQGEVNFAGYQSSLAGHVEKKVRIASANCKLSGTFGGDIEAIVEGSDYSSVGFGAGQFPEVPPGLTLTESAEIAGDLNYQSPQPALIDPASKIGGKVDHTQVESEESQAPTTQDRLMALARQFFALVLIGGIVVFICPKWTGKVVDNVQGKPLASLGWGLVSFVMVITLTVLLLVATIAVAVLLGYVSLGNLILTWVGIGVLSIVGLVIGFLIYSTWVTKIIVSVWVGNRIINGSEWSPRQRGLSLLLGVLIIVLVSWIPTVGGIFSFIVVLLGLGSTAIWMFAKPDVPVTGKPEVTGKPKTA